MIQNHPIRVQKVAPHTSAEYYTIGDTAYILHTLHPLLFIHCELIRCEGCRNAGLIGISWYFPRQSLTSPPSGTSFLDLPYPLRHRIYLLVGLVCFCPINFNQEGLKCYKYCGKHSLVFSYSTPN